MEKKAALFAIFVILSFFGIGFNSFFGQIRGNDPVPSGEVLEYHVNAVNNANNDLEDVRVSIFIYELGEFIGTNAFDVDSKDNIGKFLFLNTHSIPSGEYLARITLSNDDFRKVKHRYITII